jgi:hypothetical protein
MRLPPSKPSRVNTDLPVLQEFEEGNRPIIKFSMSFRNNKDPSKPIMIQTEESDITSFGKK